MSFAFSIYKRKYRKLPFRKDNQYNPKILNEKPLYGFDRPVLSEEEEIVLRPCQVDNSIPIKTYMNKRKLFKQLLKTQISCASQHCPINKKVEFNNKIKVKIIPSSCDFDSITKSVLWYTDLELYEFYMDRKKEELDIPEISVSKGCVWNTKPHRSNSI
jgi:hypothetical protein